MDTLRPYTTNGRIRFQIGKLYVVSKILATINEFRHEGVVLLVNNKLPGYKNICAFVESRILKNQMFKIKIVACIPAKNGYPVEIRDPKHPHYIGQRRFNTVIDLYPSLTRDPSMLLSLSNPVQDFTTISYDFSITGSKQERGGVLVHERVRARLPD
ncbi:hypothetical protein SARC_06284 [Sphaeroforma arctica JP610]|uniref:Uncharacterized protein n=1 Tax=Sphaeroforma arctica JP610 TaxID=667725 RepID=A0A0L0FX38_9EUKA|nr:hypothetical protein SARC_06284 [Sphaeroforma arctica JP610]KNC81397.1 hypothetical protein SARC_06284 [Sphaeroforma arctica JP610]|eukprot:XP_014155299.1 hypothetical protein SARC_06284 [Sphaeroforma arctica JP610]